MAGMAGTGKSTIAKTICEDLEKKEILAGAFFCSRQLEACYDHTKIIPTIAYQLAHYSRTFSEALETELKNDPHLAIKTINKQMALLTKPWKAAIKVKGLDDATPVIVIDALDECKSIECVLRSLMQVIQDDHMQQLKFIFTSRPEQLVYSYLRSSPTTSKILLHDVEEDMVGSDIKKFLSDEFKDFSFIKKGEIEKLAKMSGKSFIYGATLAKWITDNPILMQSRLNDVLDLGYMPARSDTKGLDELYSTVLKKSN